MLQMNLERISKEHYVFQYGQQPSKYYIILEGQVSMWTPVKPRNMLKPLLKLRRKIVETVRSRKEEFDDFSFQFHLDPFEIEKGRRPAYCRFEDFLKLCAMESSQSFTKFIWIQFQLHRAVDTVAMIDQMFENDLDIVQVTKYQKDCDFDVNQLMVDILNNVHDRLNNKRTSSKILTYKESFEMPTVLESQRSLNKAEIKRKPFLYVDCSDSDKISENQLECSSNTEVTSSDKSYLQHSNITESECEITEEAS